MDDDIRNEALNALRAIVWEMEDLAVKFNATLAKAKEFQGRLDALEKDRLLDEQLAKGTD